MPPEDLKRLSQDWNSYSFYVLDTLKEFKDTHEEMNRKLDALRLEMPLLKFKVGLIIAGISAGVSIIFSAIITYFFVHIK